MRLSESPSSGLVVVLVCHSLTAAARVVGPLSRARKTDAALRCWKGQGVHRGARHSSHPRSAPLGQIDGAFRGTESISNEQGSASEHALTEDTEKQGEGRARRRRRGGSLLCLHSGALPLASLQRRACTATLTGRSTYRKGRSYLQSEVSVAGISQSTSEHSQQRAPPSLRLTETITDPGTVARHTCGDEHAKLDPTNFRRSPLASAPDSTSVTHLRPPPPARFPAQHVLPSSLAECCLTFALRSE